MTEDEAPQRLGIALNRLHAFAATFATGDIVDEDSGLTADDLNVMQPLEVIHSIARSAPTAKPEDGR